MRKVLGSALIAAGIVASTPAFAQKSADTLRISMRDALPNVDPYYNNLRTGVVMHHQAWDTLVYRNPDFDRIKSLLAAPLIFDGRNLYDPERMTRLGVEYHGIGRRRA